MSDGKTHAGAKAPARKPSVRKAKEAIRDIGSRQIHDVLDGRTTAAKEFRAWRDALVVDMGGEPSAMQLSVLEQVARTKVLIDCLNAWLFSDTGRVINKSKRTVSPVVLQRQKLADSLVRYLSLLGLERRAETLTLAGYVEAEYGQGDHRDPPIRAHADDGVVVRAATDVDAGDRLRVVPPVEPQTEADDDLDT